MSKKLNGSFIDQRKMATGGCYLIIEPLTSDVEAIDSFSEKIVLNKE